MYWILGSLYCGLVWLVFAKLKLIRLSLPIAILAAAIGPAVIISLLFGAQYFHPYTMNARVFQQVIPVVPQLTRQGRVIEVAVKPNTPYKRGDLLIRIDPVPYELAVAKLAAEFEEAKQSKQVAEANVELAMAELDSANGNLDFAKKDRDRKAKLVKQAAASQQAYEASIDQYIKANAVVKQAKASLVQAQLSVSLTEAQITQTESQLSDAKYDLEQVNVKAPANGYVTKLQIQPGTLVGGASSYPIMNFVPDPDESTHGIIVAAFGQKNYLKIKKGQYAEVALNGYPGRIFKGRVLSAIDVSGAGQLIERGIVPDELIDTQSTDFAVRIKLDDSDGLRLPAGSQGQVAVYTEEMQIAGIPVMFVIRAQSWLHYLM